MRDISTCSLDELIEWATRENLLDFCHKNDWQVTLRVFTNEFTLNHIGAMLFLQGLLLGARRKQGRTCEGQS